MFAKVLLEEGFLEPLDYAIPEGQTVEIGMRVEVPLQGRTATGFILSLATESCYKARCLLGPTEPKLILPKDLFDLALFTAKYTCYPLQNVFRRLLPKAVKKNIAKRKEVWISTNKTPKELVDLICKKRARAPKQVEILEKFLHEDKEFPKEELTPTSALKALLKERILQECVPTDSFEFLPLPPKRLTEEQAKAVGAIEEALGSFQTFLLFGVTGSGKSEVYFRLIEQVLQKGQSVIFLVPEITLAVSLVDEMTKRFPATTALFHYKQSDGEKNAAWQEVYQGKKRLVIGPRSSIFAPVKNLGLVIVDEEHEGSYKQQDEAPFYHARDLAVVRGKLVGCPVVLGSATPSLESYTHALSGKYKLLTLQHRPENRTLATVDIVNMQQERGIFSNRLLRELEKRIDAGEQSILFLNRRGYRTSLFCPKCQISVQCEQCSQALTFHKSMDLLLCHLCGQKTPPPRECIHCQESILEYKGLGTELIEKTLQAIFKGVRILRMDADTTQKKGTHEKLLKQFGTHKADILLGTQMVVKGLHFPQVTLVGVLNADAYLHVPEFRASEVTFQQITQVAGRAGRGLFPGLVLLQTHLPNHIAIEAGAKQDYRAFYEEEMKGRLLFSYPPKNHLVRFVARGKDPGITQHTLEQIRTYCVQTLPPSFEVFPVLACGIEKIKEHFRFHFQIKAPKLSFFLNWMEKKPFAQVLPRKKVTLQIDVDPQQNYF